MKQHYQGTCFISFFLKLITASTGIYALVLWVYPNVYIINTININHDKQLSNSTKNNIHDFITHNLPNSKNSYKQFINKLCTQFPFLSSLTMHKTPPGIITIDINAGTPEYYINNTHLLLGNKTLCSSDIYCKEIYANIPALSIEKDSREYYDNSTLYSVLSSIKPEFFNQYFITLTRFDIYFKDKIHPEYFLRARKDDAQLRKIKEFGPRVLSILYERNTHLKKNQPALTAADFRFDKQVILSTVGG